MTDPVVVANNALATGTEDARVAIVLTGELLDAIAAGTLDNVQIVGVPIVDGKIPVAYLPGLSIGDTLPVASEAEMLALDAQRGDIAIRTDLGQSFILAGDDPTVLADWLELMTSGKGYALVEGPLDEAAASAYFTANPSKQVIYECTDDTNPATIYNEWVKTGE